jgi:hypothetical protein
MKFRKNEFPRGTILVEAISTATFLFQPNPLPA